MFLRLKINKTLQTLLIDSKSKQIHRMFQIYQNEVQVLLNAAFY